MIKLTVNELFDLNDLYFKSLFDGVLYPWEIISKIKSYIIDFDKSRFTELTNCVYVGKGVKIHPSAVIEGPAIIGAHCEIRPFAYIRGSVLIGEGSVIGNSTEIKNSVIMNSVQIPHYNYVGDSILGNRSHMGAGSVCSNLKSDKSTVVIHSEKNIQTNLKKLGAILGDGTEIGCNCVLNPGTVIGKESVVYPSNSVRGVVPEFSIYKNRDNVVKKSY